MVRSSPISLKGADKDIKATPITVSHPAATHSAAITATSSARAHTASLVPDHGQLQLKAH